MTRYFAIGLALFLMCGLPAVGQIRDIDGIFILQSRSGAEAGTCLEGNEFEPDKPRSDGAFMVVCDQVSGQRWFATPAPGAGNEEYFTLQTQFQAPKGKCFDGNSQGSDAVLGGVAYMADCDGSDSQLWRIDHLTLGTFITRGSPVSRGAPYRLLLNKAYPTVSKDGSVTEFCLNGNVFSDQSPMRGRAFMAKCEDGPSALWHFVPSDFPLGPKAPDARDAFGAGIYPEISLYRKGIYAWQKFAALNHPADPVHRGQPLAGAQLGDPAEARVWETYWHRVEMFPGSQNPVRVGNTADVTARPVYDYAPAFTLNADSFGGGGPGMNAQIWNNLDEDNELNVDQMFAHITVGNGSVSTQRPLGVTVATPTTELKGFENENRILFEAKMNEVGFNYILDQELY